MYEEKERFKPISNSQVPLEDTIISFAIVCRGTLKEFDTIKRHIATWTNARIVYQTKSLGYIKIEKEVKT